MDAAPLQILETLANRAVSLDPDMQERLRALDGNVVVIEVLGSDLVSFARFEGDRVRVGWGEPEDEDLRIRGTPANLAAYVLAARSGSADATHDLEVIGDVGLAQSLTGIMAKFDPDWEEPLSYWLGDTAARKLGNLFRSAAASATHARRAFETDMSEYLRYEAEVLPERDEVDALNAAVDNLRDDVDRLEARVRRVAGRLGTGNGS